MKYSLTTVMNNNWYQIITINTTHLTHLKKEWATFTYHGPDTRTITKLFRKTNLKIAYRTTNTIKHHLKPKNQITDIYNKSGVYQLKCNECPIKYIGQTGRTSKARFKEHIQDIRTNKSNTKFAQHILNIEHTYNTIDQTMKILNIKKKGHKLNTLERFEIYNLTTKAVQLNDTHTVTHNPIFDVLIKTYPHT
jgi:hypothetical protein